MGPEIIIVPAVFAIPSVVIVVWMALRHKEKMAAHARPQVSMPAVEARLERVEQAIEAIAIEMERVGESQRFLTRILSERPQAAQALPDAEAARRGRVITPH
jgi:hypothetical protein